ncbi:hypothetical protein BDZ89DRAFT_1159367, partial [Hymenopellis radicata]
MQLQILRVTLFLVALTVVLLTEAAPVAEDAANSDAPILLFLILHTHWTRKIQMKIALSGSWYL